MANYLSRIGKKLLSSKEIRNAGWLIGGKCFQMLFSFVVSIVTARYLGPSKYGIINYASAYIAFFSSLCTLGINSVIVKEFVIHPSEQGKTIGTTLVLRLASSLLSSIMIIGIVSIVDQGEHEVIQVTMCLCVSLFFQTFDTLNYWFQAKYESKVVSLISLIAYIMAALYRVILLVSGKSLIWFAFALSVDYCFIALFLCLQYKKEKGQKFVFSRNKGRILISQSYHYILSGLMVAIYMQTDKIMLKQMLGDVEVGYYSLAFSINGTWLFVLSAIIDSMYPTIINLFKENYESFLIKNRQLYAIVFYISVFVALFFSFFGKILVHFLYGDEYLPAIYPLRVIPWYTAFSYLGVARNAWIVCENKQKYLKYMYLCAAFVNVILNYCLIPIWGTTGAAVASLLTQICTCFLLPFLFKNMRSNALLMLDAIRLRGIR